jgi:hypothetical protein
LAIGVRRTIASNNKRLLMATLSSQPLQYAEEAIMLEPKAYKKN